MKNKKEQFFKNKIRSFGIWWDPSNLIDEYFEHYFNKNLITVKFGDGSILYGVVKITSGPKPHFKLLHKKKKDNDIIIMTLDNRCQIIDSMQLKDNLPKYSAFQKENIIRKKTR